MGLFQWMRERITEKRDRATFERPEAWTVSAFGGGGNASGVSVTEQTALRSVAVFACVRVISETLASLPLKLYRRTKDDGREAIEPFRPDPLSRLAGLFRGRPNPEITAYQFVEMLAAHICLWGNAYAEIEWNDAGEIVALWPLLPDRTYPERFRMRDGSVLLRYRSVTVDGQPLTLAGYKVLHIAGLGFDGLRGYSPIAMAAQAVGLTMATEEFGARFFGQGTTLGGVLTHPGKLSDKAFNRLKDSFGSEYSGLSNAHRMKILEEGMTWQRLGIPPEEAQFLATRQFQVTEIARLFRVPPHLIADLTRSTNNNIEHQGIEFATHTIRPWAVRWENALNVTLLDEKQQRKNFFKFQLDALLRGDMKSRYDAYAIGRNWGWLSVNDVRRAEDMNPVDGGDEYLTPMNMAPAGTLPAPDDAPASNEGANDELES